jgi:hypothetical protein
LFNRAKIKTNSFLTEKYVFRGNFHLPKLYLYSLCRKVTKKKCFWHFKTKNVFFVEFSEHFSHKKYFWTLQKEDAFPGNRAHYSLKQKCSFSWENQTKVENFVLSYTKNGKIYQKSGPLFIFLNFFYCRFSYFLITKCWKKFVIKKWKHSAVKKFKKIKSCSYFFWYVFCIFFRFGVG